MDICFRMFLFNAIPFTFSLRNVFLSKFVLLLVFFYSHPISQIAYLKNLIAYIYICMNNFYSLFLHDFSKYSELFL